LAALSGLISVHRSLLAVGLPLWIVTRTSAPHSLVTLLIGMNTVLVMLLQVRFASTANGLSEAAHAVRRAGVALLLFSALISFSAQVQGWLTVGVLVAATVALTTGELWHSAGAWGLSLALAPQQARGRFLTVFNLGATVLDITGAVIVTFLVLPAGDAGWLALGGLLTIAGFLAVPATRWAAHEVALAPVEPAGRR
jgi:dipeptide/tripeptide permease